MLQNPHAVEEWLDFLKSSGIQEDAHGFMGLRWVGCIAMISCRTRVRGEASGATGFASCVYNSIFDKQLAVRLA